MEKKMNFLPQISIDQALELSKVIAKTQKYKLPIIKQIFDKAGVSLSLTDDRLFSNIKNPEIGDFIRDHIISGGKTQAAEIYKKYCQWCGDKGFSPVSHKALSLTLKGTGFCSAKRNGGYSIWDITLI
jgi:hypothetical protein